MKIAAMLSAGILAVTMIASAAPAQQRVVVRHDRTVVRHSSVRHVNHGFNGHRTRRVCRVVVRNHRRVRTCRTVRY